MFEIFYLTFIQQSLDNCATLWGVESDVNKLYKLHKSAARLILNKHPQSNSFAIFQELEIIPFPQRIKVSTLLFYLQSHK